MNTPTLSTCKKVLSWRTRRLLSNISAAHNLAGDSHQNTLDQIRTTRTKMARSVYVWKDRPLPIPIFRISHWYKFVRKRCHCLNIRQCTRWKHILPRDDTESIISRLEHTKLCTLIITKQHDDQKWIIREDGWLSSGLKRVSPTSRQHV